MTNIMADIEETLTPSSGEESLASVLNELSKDLSSPSTNEQGGFEKREDSTPSPPRFRVIRRLSSSSSSTVYSPSFNQKEWPFFTCLFLVTILSFATRLYQLNEPQHVA